jgi:hypothetical protein
MRGTRDPSESEVSARARRSTSCIDSPVARPRFRLAVVRRPVVSLSEPMLSSNTGRPVHIAQCHPTPTSARWDCGQRRPNSKWLCTASRTRKDTCAQPSAFRPRTRRPRGEPLYTWLAARTPAFEVPPRPQCYRKGKTTSAPVIAGSGFHPPITSAEAARNVLGQSVDERFRPQAAGRDRLLCAVLAQRRATCSGRRVPRPGAICETFNGSSSPLGLALTRPTPLYRRAPSCRRATS